MLYIGTKMKEFNAVPGVRNKNYCTLRTKLALPRAIRRHPAARVLLSGIPAAIDEMTGNKPGVYFFEEFHPARARYPGNLRMNQAFP